MNSIDYLEACKKATECTSDYALAKKLGVTRATISAIKTGKTHEFNDETALKVAETLSINPMQVIADCAAAKAKTPESRARWEIVGAIARDPKSELNRARLALC